MAPDQVPTFVEQFNTVVKDEIAEITNSSATIAAVVQILSNIANVSTAFEESVAKVSCLSIYPDESDLKKKISLHVKNNYTSKY